MSFLSTAASVLSGNFLEGAHKIINDFVASPEDKLKAQQAAAELAEKHAELVESTAQKETDAKASIMVAELSQDDKYTKRVHATIIYTGMAAMVLNSCLLPWTTYLAGLILNKTIVLPGINLPPEFYYAWVGASGIYSIGQHAVAGGFTMPFCKPNPSAN